MDLLTENLNHHLTEDNILEAPTPMWMNYMDAFTKFVEQSTKRFERYETYEEMDKYPEIHLALDIISTEIFVFDAVTNSPFLINTYGKVPENILSKIISQFTDVLKLKTVLPTAVRECLKYGDSFYYALKDKDNKTLGLRKIKNKDIDFIEYDEYGVNPLNYYINSAKIDDVQNNTYLQFLKFQDLKLASEQQNVLLGAKEGEKYYVIPANRVIRFMNKGEDSQYFPFGESYLESIFTYWKKVSLLEDSLIIYRIVRAPERRVFYIDVGKAPAKVAEKVLNQTKEEIKRRRVAASQENKDLGIVSNFNPLSMQEDYFFAQRCLSLDTEIKLVDGRNLTLKKIIEEYEDGKKNYVYSIDRNKGKIIKGEIEWAGITRKNTIINRVMFDDGSYVICTPDHKFVLDDGSYCEAKDLLNKNVIIDEAVRVEIKPKSFIEKLKNFFKNEVKYIYNEYKTVIRVEKLNDLMDTGCLTIKDPGDNHNFQLSNGVFVKNSDGRGSKVETLPGASNLDQIKDINYFYKKLILSLRVPPSYFNTESPQTFNDGKVSSALVEEVRFGKWLTEIRDQFIYPFKVLFKDFLKEKGIDIKMEDFEFHWKESINVAENQELEKMVQRQSVFTGFPSDQFAPTYLQKKILNWSEEEIQENLTQLKKWNKMQEGE